MRNLIRRPVKRRAEPPPPTRANETTPLRPWQIRDRCFPVTRRGLDPVEIRAFLHQVADELTVAQTALVAVQEENVRIKDALRAWQSAQFAQRHYR
ncbi:DivIVA domain-containing protein [Micromonospora krabiensis]|uniref:DivIVA domain-containing protein n=1 Tax=Micromonospora krabiensis TaxID=307121 RepID=A0A1C3N7D6_9ACTN|nr:DivIVA domain-containing protein [Micromonospora krabiensis]SBV28456.1 DivIVA domain-containing protein [Micromonospora krabiensis]